MDHALASRLAEAAHAFQRKLARLPEDLAPQRLQSGAPWPLLAAVADSGVRARLAVRLLPGLSAPRPPLARLLERAPRLALLDRGTLLLHWCVLALAARPGVLRCCIARDVRAALQGALGPAFDALLSAGPMDRGVSEHAARWTPLHWACVGYFDWVAMLTPDDAALQRLARLSLPPGLMAVEHVLHVAPAQTTPARALALIDELQLEWSC